MLVQALSLVCLDEDTWLVIRVGRERLTLCGDSGIALDESSHDTTSCFDTNYYQGTGATSRRSCVLSEVSPERMAACTAAPYATASSGLMLLLGSLPLKKSDASLTMRGICTEPPIKTISWTLFLSIFEL